MRELLKEAEKAGFRGLFLWVTPEGLFRGSLVADGGTTRSDAVKTLVARTTPEEAVEDLRRMLKTWNEILY